MNSQRKRTFKPIVLVAAGVVLGGAALATILTITQQNPATAQSSAKARLASFESSTNLRTMRDLDSSFAELASYVSPSVVHIRADKTSAADQDASVAGSQGSGVIYRADGYIVTNDHVVAGTKTVTVIFNDGRRVNGTVISGGDAQNDLAVVKVEKNNLPAAVFADSARVRVGQFAMAVGAPFGIENSVTFGHISGLGRANQILDPRTSQVRGYTNLIQTDAAINPGNSGGPLFNIDGEVIGINSSIVGGSSSPFGGQGGNVGIGFSIPSNQAKFIADLLISKGKLERGFLGVSPRDLLPYEKQDKNLGGGAYVEALGDNTVKSPAREAGIKEGDVITRIGDMQISGQQDLRNAMFKYGKGSRVAVEYIRGGNKNSTNVTIGELPTQPTARNATPRNGLRMPFDRDDLFAPFEDTPKSEQAPRSDRAENGQRPRLGVGVADVTSEVRSTKGIPASISGAYVTSVSPGSIADEAGISVGDLITSLNGREIKSAQDLVNEIKRITSGSSVSITVRSFDRSGTQAMRTFTIEL